MSKNKNESYSLETKLKAIEMRKNGSSIKEIQTTLGIKSESQVYTWWYWYRDGEVHRLSQPAGKQYSYGKGPDNSLPEENLKLQINSLEYQVKLLKKYNEMERRWYRKSL